MVKNSLFRHEKKFQISATVSLFFFSLSLSFSAVDFLDFVREKRASLKKWKDWMNNIFLH